MQRTQTISRVGATTYRTELAYVPAAVAEMRGLVADGQIVPERFILSWYQDSDGMWQRNVMGSYAYGFRKGVADENMRRRLIYSPDIPVLRGWASLLPGLRARIEEIEAKLPE